jgi:cell surface protein SprA
MFMTGFNQEVTVRFGALDLVREDDTNTLDFKDTNVADDKTDLDVLVNVQENDRCPVNYIIPPGSTEQLC